MIKTYSCGRGVHYMFVGGLVPYKFGIVYYTKQGIRDIEVRQLRWFERIKYFFKKLSIQNSLYFTDTTDIIAKDIEGGMFNVMTL